MLGTTMLLSGWETAFDAVMAVVSVIVVIWLAYKYSVWLSRRGMSGTSGKYVTVLDRVALGQDKALVLVKVGGKTLLLGVANNSITILQELSDLPTPPAPPVKDFKSVMTDVLNNNLPFTLGKKKEK